MHWPVFGSWIVIAPFINLNQYIPLATRFTDAMFSMLIFVIFIINATSSTFSPVGIYYYFDAEHISHDENEKNDGCKFMHWCPFRLILVLFVPFNVIVLLFFPVADSFLSVVFWSLILGMEKHPLWFSWRPSNWHENVATSVLNQLSLILLSQLLSLHSQPLII